MNTIFSLLTLGLRRVCYLGFNAKECKSNKKGTHIEGEREAELTVMGLINTIRHTYYLIQYVKLT